MLKHIQVRTGLLALAALFCTISAYGQGQNSAKIPVTTTVTVLGPKFSAPPPLTKQDILVYSRKTRLDVINWVPAQGERAPLQLAVVIDNSANQLGVGSQLNDIAGFISLQSKSTSVGVFYAVNGTVQTASNFTTDHAAAAKALRLTFGPRAGDSPSVYLSVSDLVKNKWPATGARREILLISSGIDRLDKGPKAPTCPPRSNILEGGRDRTCHLSWRRAICTIHTRQLRTEQPRDAHGGKRRVRFV